MFTTRTLRRATLIAIMIAGASPLITSHTFGQDSSVNTSLGQFDFDAMNEDIEIMQRIFKKALGDHFAALSEAALKEMQAKAELESESKDDDGDLVVVENGTVNPFVTTIDRYQGLLASPGSSISVPNFSLDGYYIPKTGPLFTLKFPVDVLEKNPPQEVVEESTTEKADLWNQTESDLRNPSPASSFFSNVTTKKEPKTVWVVDENALDRTLTIILKAAGQYGSKIDQLQSGESIIVVAEVRGQRRAVRNVDNSIRLLYASNQGVMPRNRVIITIPVEALQASAASNDEGELDMESLRKAVELTMYPMKDTGWSNRGSVTYAPFPTNTSR